MKKTLPKEQVLHHCKFCKDEGMFFKNVDGYEVGVPCNCNLKEEMIKKADNSGLGELVKTKTFENYNVEGKYQDTIKMKAIDYTKEFLKGNRYSFSLLGQSGVGKSHIMTAVASKLLDNNVQVKFYIAQQIVQKLNASKYDTENYVREFSAIANAEVLFIDDLFKTSIKNYYQVESIDSEEFRPIFEIINYRYNKNKPILLNSEIHFERFLDIDQATIGRINEMCNYEHLVSIKPDEKKNYRLRRR